MSESQKEQVFLGTGWGFPPEFNKRVGGVMMVSEDDDIQESLSVLLSTSPGERTMYPTYGCRLRSLVFDTISEGAMTEITDVIERAILFFEPRIILGRVEINTETMVEGLIQIQLTYTIRATNSRSNMVYPFYFQEGTNIAF